MEHLALVCVVLAMICTFESALQVLLGVDSETVLALADLDGVLVPLDSVLFGPCKEVGQILSGHYELRLGCVVGGN